MSIRRAKRSKKRLAQRIEDFEKIRPERRRGYKRPGSLNAKKSRGPVKARRF